MDKQTLIRHLQVQHGYRDEVDDTVEAAKSLSGYGIVRLDHPVWTEHGLNQLHDDDHADYPDTGTPVKGWAHKHKG
ncbi:MAG: hypothetical protein LC650_00635 [Actinobacteria bacterium]|nr:hypothetical protein [Actinomycetota bacterium]